MKGKLIVFEGTDGSGKSTQFARLCQRVTEMGLDFQKLTFPQYAEPSSALIRMYLGGEFGNSPGDVNPYAASAFYAVDRYASLKKVWGEYYEKGGLILADRYITSNAVHQASKVPENEREDFFRWLEDFECGKLGLPQADVVLYMDMPTEKAVELLRARESATNTHADIHEVDTEYLKTCRTTALEAAEFYGWQRVSCVNEVGEVRGIEEIAGEIDEILAPILK